MQYIIKERKNGRSELVVYTNRCILSKTKTEVNTAAAIHVVDDDEMIEERSTNVVME